METSEGGGREQHLMALQGEHDDDGVDEAEQRDGAEVGHEVLLKALLANSGQERVAGDDAGHKGHTQEEQHAPCNLPEADVDASSRPRAA